MHWVKAMKLQSCNGQSFPEEINSDAPVQEPNLIICLYKVKSKLGSIFICSVKFGYAKGWLKLILSSWTSFIFHCWNSPYTRDRIMNSYNKKLYCNVCSSMSNAILLPRQMFYLHLISHWNLHLSFEKFFFF